MAGKLNPQFPVVEGDHRLTATWSVSLPTAFNRRVDENGDLVLWRPGLTAIFATWGNDRGETRAERKSWLLGDTSPDAYDLIQEELGAVSRFAYRLREKAEDRRAPALYGFTVGDASHVQLAVYFDDEQDLELALGIWRSLRTSAVPPCADGRRAN